MLSTKEADRRESIDALRALALFGVIIMNVLAITMVVASRQVIAAAGPLDMVVGGVELVLVGGKARSCFAFLFGVGFGMALLRAEENGSDAVRAHLRRMAVLFAFGVLNQIFLFFGDILARYALLGALLPLARGWTDRGLLRAGLLLIVVPPLLSGLYVAAAGEPVPNLAGAGPEELARQTAAGLEAYRSPNYIDAVAHNITVQASAYATATAHRIEYDAAILGLFLLGLLAARHRLLLDAERHRALLRRVAWWCLPTGLAASAIQTAGLFGMLPHSLGGLAVAAFAGLPVMAAGLMAAATLWFARGAGRLQRLLAPAGRMSLTHYLLSGAIGVWAFQGWGLGWLGELNIAAMALFALVVCVGLTAFSHLWLRGFHFGPAEWVWRASSKGRAPLPPFRRGPATLRPGVAAVLLFVAAQALVVAGAVTFLSDADTEGSAGQRAGARLI